LRRALALLIAAISLAPLPVLADGEGDVAPMSAAERAEEHSRLGVEFYQAGRFPEAVREMMAAYEAVPDATLLYNVARIYEKMGQSDLAIRFFKRFVGHEGADPDTVQEALEHMESLANAAADGRPVAPVMALEEPAAAAAGTSQEGTTAKQHPAPWIAGSVAAGSLALLAASGVGALVSDATEHDTTLAWDERVAAKELADDLALVADVSLGVAAAAAVVTVIAALATRKKMAPVTLLPIGPGDGPGLSLRVRFGAPDRQRP
jgi:tetratricopeptide (TPR) repeat protein